MTFEELVDAVVEYGFNHRPRGQLERMVKVCAGEVVRKEPWPCRERTATGPAPLTILDLGQIDTVVRDGVRIEPARRSEVIETYGRTSDVGDCWYWIERGTDVCTGRAGELEVAYFTADAWADGGAEPGDERDTPILPERYQEIIVRLVVADCFDEATQPDVASVHRARADVILGEMREQYLVQQGDEPDVVRMTGSGY